MLGSSDHMEDDDQDKGDEEIRECVEALERERERKRSKHGETTHGQTHDDNVFVRHALQHLEPRVHTSRRLQWIAISCKRNQR